MKYAVQFLIIIAFCLAGELLGKLIPLPIPASIYGIILLFLALEFKLVKVSDIKETSSFLIATMPIMFLPPAVGLVTAWDSVKDSLLEFGAITVISTFVVMAAAGWATQLVIREGGRTESKRQQR